MGFKENSAIVPLQIFFNITGAWILAMSSFIYEEFGDKISQHEVVGTSNVVKIDLRKHVVTCQDEGFNSMNSIFVNRQF